MIICRQKKEDFFAQVWFQGRSFCKFYPGERVISEMKGKEDPELKKVDELWFHDIGV